MNPINAFFNTIPVVGTIVTLITNFISKQITTSFCTQKSQGLFNGLDDDAAYAIQVATVVGIDGGANNKETCPQNNWGDSGGGAGDLGCGGPGTCNHVYRIKDGGNQFWENPVYEGGPHYVVQYAYNGSDWMHVWSIVWGGNRTEQAEKKVAVAGMDSKQGSGTWTSVIPTDSDLTFSIYMAESEFYFDCADKWTASSCNGSNDASYNMNWRARLRRMHGLSFGKDLFNYIWGGSFGTTFDKKATTFIQGAMAPIFQSVAGKFATFANFAAVTGTYKALKNYAGNAIGGAINPASVIPDIIH
jgi:hypothetical protein